MGTLTKKVAIVTGSSDSIGRANAERIAQMVQRALRN